MSGPSLKSAADLRTAEEQGCKAPGLLEMTGRPPHVQIAWRSVDSCRRVRANLSIYPRYAELSNDRERIREIGELFRIPHGDRSWAAIAAAIDAYVHARRLPPLVPLFEPGTNGISERVRHPFKDPRFSVAVLAKSSSKVFLTSRPPLLSGVDPARDLVLALPLEWKATR